MSWAWWQGQVSVSLGWGVVRAGAAGQEGSLEEAPQALLPARPEPPLSPCRRRAQPQRLPAWARGARSWFCWRAAPAGTQERRPGLGVRVLLHQVVLSSGTAQLQLSRRSAQPGNRPQVACEGGPASWRWGSLTEAPLVTQTHPESLQWCCSG